MIRIVTLFILVCLPAVAQCQQAGHSTCCSSLYTPQQLDSISLENLGKEFKRLRSSKCEGCAYFSSGLHSVMEVLGKRLDGKSKREVRKIMGKPDEKDKTTLIYHWRGQGHDYLLFDGRSKVKSEWYHAYE